MLPIKFEFFLIMGAFWLVFIPTVFIFYFCRGSSIYRSACEVSLVMACALLWARGGLLAPFFALWYSFIFASCFLNSSILAFSSAVRCSIYRWNSTGSRGYGTLLVWTVWPRFCCFRIPLGGLTGFWWIYFNLFNRSSMLIWPSAAPPTFMPLASLCFSSCLLWYAVSFSPPLSAIVADPCFIAMRPPARPELKPGGLPL